MLNSRQLLLFIMAIKIGGKLQTYNYNVTFPAYDLHVYSPFGCASGNIDPKPGMSHYIPCLIAE
jgi:hypothetical protein